MQGETLFIRYPDGRQDERVLGGRTIRIGRASDNDIVLDDAQVADYHAEILRDDEGVQILDLDSPGGTMVDGTRLTRYDPHPLARHSTIQIGAVEMQMTPLAASARAPTALPAGGQPSASSQIYLRLTPAAVTVVPGGSVLLHARVANRSSLVDGIDLAVSGVPLEWVTSTFDQTGLMPGEEREAQIELKPPHAADSYAGVYALEVVARSRTRPGDQVIQPATLTIDPYIDFTPELDPQEVTARFKGDYYLRIHNRSNAEIPFTFAGHNEKKALAFRFRPRELRVGPDEKKPAQMSVRLRTWRLLGRSQKFPLSVTVTPAGEVTRSKKTEGSFDQEPIPPVVPLALGLLLFMLCCIGLLMVPQFQRAITATQCRIPIVREFAGCPGDDAVGALAPVLPTLSASSVEPSDPAGGEEEETEEPSPTNTLTPTNTITSTSTSIAPTETIGTPTIAPTQELLAPVTPPVLPGSTDVTTPAVTSTLTVTPTIVTPTPDLTQTAVISGLIGTVTAQAGIQTAIATANAQTQTAIATANAQTQTAFAREQQTTQRGLQDDLDDREDALEEVQTEFALTRTADAPPTVTPTNVTPVPPTVTPMTVTPVPPTVTPTTVTPVPPTIATPVTPVPEFDEQIRFTEFNGGVTVRTLFRGDEYARQNVLICFYSENSNLDEPASGPRCNSPIAPSRQVELFVHPRRTLGNAPVEVLSSAETITSTGVINFFQRDVSDVAVNIYLDGSNTYNYTISGYTEIGVSSPVTTFSTGGLNPAGSYQLTLSSPEQPIRQVVIQGTNDAAPLYIVSIALRYAR
jgi:hypothetical protein